MRHVRHVLRVTLLLSGLLATAPAWGASQTLGPTDDVEGAINAMMPGDELILLGGMYMLSERFSFSIAGTEAQPIVIRAMDGERPHFHRPDASQNIVDVDNAEYVILRGIEFSG